MGLSAPPPCKIRVKEGGGVEVDPINVVFRRYKKNIRNDLKRVKELREYTF